MSNSIIAQSKHNVNNQAGGSPAAPQAQKAPNNGNSPPLTHAGHITPASPAAASDTALSTLLCAPEPPAAPPLEDTEEIRYLFALELVRRIDASLTSGDYYCTEGGRYLFMLGEVVQAILDGVLEAAR